MRKPTIYFADTTIVYYRLHGHQLLQPEVTDLVKDGVLCTSNFVKEEIRGYITGLIELFCVIQEEDSGPGRNSALPCRRWPESPQSRQRRG